MFRLYNIYKVSKMDDKTPIKMHAFNHAPAALRIFRFAADSVPRILDLAHTSPFLRECAIEFGSTDATLHVAMENDHAAGRYRFGHNIRHCPWLMRKMLECRVGAPMPPAALAPNVTRHDVNWGAEGAYCHEYLQLTHNGFGLKSNEPTNYEIIPWVQSPVGVTSGKHWFSVTIIQIDSTMGCNGVKIGWIGRTVQYGDPEPDDEIGMMFMVRGLSNFETIPRKKTLMYHLPESASCTIACLFDLDTGVMMAFVDGQLVETYSGPRLPRNSKLFPTVAMGVGCNELYSNSI